MRGGRLIGYVAACAIATYVSSAHADATEEARTHFIRGAKLAEEAQWSDALSAFEASAALKSHPLTTYNIGACERALGRYTRARKALRAALAENQASGGTAIKAVIVADGKAFLAEIETKVAKLDVRVVPADAKLSVDGRPLELDGSIAIAGTRAPGPGEATPPSPFKLEIDPGTHTFTLTRAGLGDTSLSLTLTPGQKTEVELKHEPPKGGVAVLMSESSPALGAVDGGALHALPWTAQLPPGPHDLTVRVPGHPIARDHIDVKPGATSTYALPAAPLPNGGLVIAGTAGSIYSIDGVFTGALPLLARGVGAGAIRIDVSKAGYRPWTGTVVVPPGKTATIDVKLARDTDRRPDTLFWVGGAVTVGLAAAAITTGLFALDTKRTYDGLVAEGRNRNDSEALEVANRGEVLVSITNVLWIGAAVTGVSTAGWYFFGGEPTPSTAATRIQ